jgi:hypothetical protein
MQVVSGRMWPAGSQLDHAGLVVLNVYTYLQDASDLLSVEMLWCDSYEKIILKWYNALSMGLG